MDAITISNFILRMHIGLTEEERAKPQRVRIDVKLGTDFSEVISSGNLECGVNYSHVRRAIRDIALHDSFILLETFGSVVIRRLLEESNGRRVTIRIRKLDRWNDAVPGIEMSRRKCSEGNVR